MSEFHVEPAEHDFGAERTTEKPRTWTLDISETDPPIIGGIRTGRDQTLKPPVGITAVPVIELEPVLDLLEEEWLENHGEHCGIANCRYGDTCHWQTVSLDVLHEHGRLRD